jgi:hypothetical protein
MDEIGAVLSELWLGLAFLSFFCRFLIFFDFFGYLKKKAQS